MSEDSNKYREYAEVFPKEIRLMVDSLSGQNDLRYAVVILLLDEGYLPFSGIKEQLEVHPQRLTEALDALQEGGIVRWQAEEDLSSRTSGNYCITDFGKEIIDGFYQAMRPKYRDTDALRVDYEEIEEMGEIEDYQRSTTPRDKERVSISEINAPVDDVYPEGDSE